jgi:hypothetical protein
MDSAGPFITTYAREEGVPNGLAYFSQRGDLYPSASIARPHLSPDDSTTAALGVWQQPLSISKQRRTHDAYVHIPSEVPYLRKPTSTTSGATSQHKTHLVLPLYPIRVCTNVIPVRVSRSAKTPNVERAGPWVARIGGLPLKHLSLADVLSLGHLTANTAPRPLPPRYTDYLHGDAKTLQCYKVCLHH